MAKTKIVASADMAGLKIGIYFPHEQTIYVSQHIYSLCKDDLNLMKKNLTVFICKMPILLSDYIKFLVAANKDIFVPRA
jgi:hypothetical protein